MKRIVIAGLLLVSTCLSSWAQQSSPQGDPDHLFFLATEQFQTGEYAGSFRAIETWLEESRNPAYLEEASFIRAACAYELNRNETSVLLIDFLTKYPASPYSERVSFLLGCCAMNAGQYNDALSFFRRCPESSLQPDEQTELRFRYAYISMRLSDYKSARILFTELANGESRYAASSGYFLAYMDYAEGKYREAASSFKNYADDDQLNGALPCFTVQLLYASGSIDVAIQLAHDVLPTVKDSLQKTELIRLLAAANFDKKEYDESRKYYIEYLTNSPQVHRTDNYRIGVLNYMAYEYSRAEARLSEVAGKEDAIGQSASYHLGLCYLKDKNYDQARMCFEQASLTDFDKSTKEKALYNYAVICYETSYSAFNEQVTAFQRFLDEFPQSSLVDNANGYLAEALLSSKDYKNALVALERVAKPDDNLLKTKIRILFMLGVESFDNKDYSNALHYFNLSTDLSGKLSVPVTETYYWRGEAYYQLHQYGQALADYRRFSEQPDVKDLKAWPSTLYGLGYSNFELKKYPESVKWFEKFTLLANAERDSRYPDVLCRIGDSYLLLKNYGMAVKIYQQADNATEGGNDYAVYQAAMALGIQKDYQAKLTMLTQFGVRFATSDYADDVLFETGKTYVDLRRNEEAIAAFSRLMDSCQTSPLASKAGLEMAQLHMNDKDTAQAITDYKRIIETYPGSPEAQTALPRLKKIYASTNSVSSYVSYTSSLKAPVILASDEQDSLSYTTAETLLTDGKSQAADSAFQKYLTDFPNGHRVMDSHYHLAKLRIEAGNPSDAIPHLTTLSEQAGSRYQTECLNLLAEAYYAQKDYQEAIDNFTQLEKLAVTKNDRMVARTGILRCKYGLGMEKEVITAATNILSEKGIDANLLKEARYYRAKSYLNTGKKELAKPDLILLSTEVQTAYGAESRFLLAELYFNQKNLKESERLINKTIQEGTPQSYWLAQSFLLLSDIYVERKDDFQAKQYLLSLKENYKADDDIAGLIQARLDKIAQRNH